MIFNNQTEQNILGSILHLQGYGEHVENALDSLTANDFYSAFHKSMFNAMKDLQSKNINPNLMSLMEHNTVINDDDLFRYIAELDRNTTSALNLSHHVTTLRKITELRETQLRVNEVNSIIASGEDIDSKLDEIQKLFSYEFGATSNEVGAKHISDCMGQYIDRLDQRWNNPDEVLFTTGIPDFDKILGGGFEIGLHAIGANPKMGKTELMGKMINHFAVDRKLPVYVGSLEMPDFQVIERLVSSYGRIDKTALKSNFEGMGDYERQGWHDAHSTACGHVGYSDIYIDDRHSNSVKKIRRECLKIQKKHGRLGGIFVDYLTLLDADGTHDRHDLAVGSMTRALKGMSKEFMCPVIMLLQLNRGNTSRQDKRPLASDSRDSGSIEQDVDSWTGLYRDSVYNTDSPWKNITEIIVRLNRHGETGTCYQLLTGTGFVDADLQKVAELVHLESTSTQTSTSNF